METLVNVLSDERVEVVFAGGDRIFYNLREPIKIDILANSGSVIDLDNLKGKLEEFYNYSYRNADLSNETIDQLVERITMDMKLCSSLDVVNKNFKRKRVWYYQHKGEDIQRIDKWLGRTWLYNIPLGDKEMSSEERARLCGSLEEVKDELIKYDGTVVWSRLEPCNPFTLFGVDKRY